MVHEYIETVAWWRDRGLLYARILLHWYTLGFAFWIVIDNKHPNNVLHFSPFLQNLFAARSLFFFVEFRMRNNETQEICHLFMYYLLMFFQWNSFRFKPTNSTYIKKTCLKYAERKNESCEVGEGDEEENASDGIMSFSLLCTQNYRFIGLFFRVCSNFDTKMISSGMWWWKWVRFKICVVFQIAWNWRVN